MSIFCKDFPAFATEVRLVSDSKPSVHFHGSHVHLITFLSGACQYESECTRGVRASW